MLPARLWSPSSERKERSAMLRFWRDAERHFGLSFADYDALHAFSVARAGDFWRFFLGWSGIVSEGSTTPPLEGTTMLGARFFPNLRLSFTENLLRYNDDRLAL